MNNIYFENFFVNVMKRKISDVYEHQWECFKENRYNISSETKYGYVNITYSADDGKVLTSEVSDIKNGKAYSYVDEDFLEEYTEFLTLNWANLDLSVDVDGIKYERVDSAADYMEKCGAILDGKEYDERMLVENIQLSDEDFNYLAKMAHERDITFNKLIEQILSEKLKEVSELKNR